MTQKEFLSYNCALEYAKDKVVSAIRAEKPYESAVIIDRKSNNVIIEFSGDVKHVNIDDPLVDENVNDNILVHAHPTYFIKEGTEYTTPVSIGDFEVLHNKGNEVIAFNSSCEYSSLKKTVEYRINSDEDVELYKNKYNAYLIENFSDKYTLKLINLVVDNISKELTEYEFKKKSRRIFDRFQITEEGINAIHNFWQKYANEMGLDYTTNYSYLA